MSTHRQVILLMTDTQRTDMVGCYGNESMRTPNLDRIATEGIRFNRAYTCQPVCGPARSAMFTGQYPHSNGVWANSMALTDNVKTIGQRLCDNGVHSAYVGKWHLDGSDYFGTGRCPSGWDPLFWYDMRTYLDELSEDERRWSRTPRLMRERKVSENFTYAHRCSNRAVDFLSKFQHEDFFLVVSYDEPHDPYISPEPYSSMYSNYEFPKSPNVYDRLENKPEYQRVWAGNSVNEDKDSLRIMHPYFFGCNSYVDYEIGRVMKAIDQYAPDALVIYTSDHGDMLHSHSLTGKGPAAYEEIAHIPLLIRWPGRAPQGVSCPHVVSHIDLVPTILEVFNLPIPKLLEGESILRTLIDPSVPSRDVAFIEFGRYEIDHDGFGGMQLMRSAVDGRYKLSINLMSGDEFYDLEEDPYEMVNLIESPGYQVHRDRLHNQILNWMNTTRDPFRSYYWEHRPWRDDARPATWGYTGMTRQRENEEYEPRQLDYATGLPMTEAVRKK